jgi:dTDP-4-dehydrorhamnose reductase
MSQPRVLITGTTGFVGLPVHRDLKDEFHVIGSYRGESPGTEGVEWIEFEGAHDSPLDLVERARPDVILHLLALSRTEKCAKQPEAAADLNTRLTLELAEAALVRDIRFLFTSTDQVFDGTQGNYSEKDPPHPNGVYAQTKIDAENGLAKIFENVPERLTVFRLALSYGHSDEKHPGPVGWIVNSLRKGEPVNLFVDEIRSPLYVADIGRAVTDVIRDGHSGLFHLGGSDSIDRHRFGVRIAEKLGLPVELCLARSVKDYPGPEPRSPNCSFNIGHFVETFGWTPVGIEEGLERILKDNSR